MQPEAIAPVAPIGPARAGLCLPLAALAVVQLLAVNFWPHFASPNERPRAYQALAVVHRGCLDIGPELARWGGSEDVAAREGRLYPNKAPGMLPLLLPGVALAHLLAPCGSDSELAWALVLGRLLASTVPSWVALALLWRRPSGGPLLAAAWAFATPALAASLLLFSHALAACLLLAALVLLERGSRGSELAAGVALGWACVSEYPLVVPATVLVLTTENRGGWRHWLAVGVGAALPLSLLATYNATCFGSPWSLSSAHETHAGFAALGGIGVFGIGVPSWRGLWGLVLSPERGLACWAPLVLVAGVGLVRLRAAAWRSIAPAGLAFASLLVLMAGYRNWHGGWFPGPRYLLAGLPLLLLAVALGVPALLARPTARIALAAAALGGVATSCLAIVSFPFPPETVPLPSLTLAPTLLADGIVFPSWAGKGPWIAAVAAAAVLAGRALLRAVTRTHRELLLAVAIAAGALLAGGAWAGSSPGWTTRLQVAVIRDLYGDGTPRGALAALRRECDTPQRCAQVERWLAELNGP
ncbi:MAG TPA: hypothetical protein P5234_04570 [Thermoanaerobaculaceae bacterium]|nr:hypothetical protein [Thermoanaerobaculaceae bacterium]HRS15505.1 hypothetical protein [Thermoanaerobaculaceae bacterium]